MGVIDAVVFDFGNVLAMVDRRACADALARHSALSPEQVEKKIWGTEIELLAETGAVDAREHHRRLRDELGAPPDWSFRQFQEEFIEGFSRNEEGIEAMRLARSLGKRVFVLSNTSYTHARWLFADEELVAIPEGHVFSFKVGVMKPDPAIWRHLLTTRCLAADRCVYIDDVRDYCHAAGLLGFRSIVYTRGRTDLLRELRALLDR